MKTFLTLLLAAAAQTFVLAASQPLALVPFSYAGRIVDYAHIGYDADSPAEIRAFNSDGDLIAKTTTATGANSPYNYVLDIPIASQDITGYAQVGETLTFVVIDPDGAIYTGLVSAQDCVVGNPGDLRQLDIVLATDSDNDGVSDEYVELLSYLMYQHGITSYDAAADYDNDGVSNYDEYVAGTNPFDPTDKFAIREVVDANTAAEYLSFRFLANQGRTYTVETTFDLLSGIWSKTPFRVGTADSNETIRLNTGTTETGYRTVYLLKEGSISQFWKITVE